ncbi:uncharacterized protein [Palaemon carinicauda]|uniref:uncharacterized protein n=1 Tax=Palaemon carinicauda TaxID=392227 RepID=UPI0035B665BE
MRSSSHSELPHDLNHQNTARTHRHDQLLSQFPASHRHLLHAIASFKGDQRDLKCNPLPEVVFCNAVNALSITAALTFPLPHAPLFLFSDASDITIVAVPEQVFKGSTRPLAFFNRKLSKIESSYFTSKCKVLGVYLAWFEYVWGS